MNTTKKRRLEDVGGKLMAKEEMLRKTGSLFLCEKGSDITLVVENERLPAHKFILISQSDYFDAMFNNDMIECKQTEICLKETPLPVFKLLLKFAYYGEIEFDLPVETIVQLLGMLQRYQFLHFEAPVLNKISSMLNANNIWTFFQFSLLHKVTACVELCNTFIDQNATQLVGDGDKFFDLPVGSLKELLKRDTLLIKELDLFRAVKQYFERNDLDELMKEEIKKCVRFSLIDFADLFKEVSTSDVVSKNFVWELSHLKAKVHNEATIVNRGFRLPDVNISSLDYEFKLLEGSLVTLKLANSRTNTGNKKIVMKFALPFNINYIELALSNVKGDRYSYKVEYSVDGDFWNTIYDYTNFTCSNSQSLCFEPVVAEYLRIFGFHQIRTDSSTKSEFDEIESIKCMFQSHRRMIKVDRINGLLSSLYYVRRIPDRVYHDAKAAFNPNDRYYSRQVGTGKVLF